MAAEDLCAQLRPAAERRKDPHRTTAATFCRDGHLCSLSCIVLPILVVRGPRRWCILGKGRKNFPLGFPIALQGLGTRSLPCSDEDPSSRIDNDPRGGTIHSQEISCTRPIGSVQSPFVSVFDQWSLEVQVLGSCRVDQMQLAVF